MSRVYKVKVSDTEAMVDPSDAHLVRQYAWHRGGTKDGYAATTIKGKTTYMHRLILGAAASEIVDHIDGNPLNNRRSNLRIVTRSQNAANLAFSRNPYGFKGVCFYPEKNRYQGRVCKDSGTFRGPYRKTPEEAARDYDAMARGIHGDHTTYNFPLPGERGVIVRPA